MLAALNTAVLFLGVRQLGFSFFERFSAKVYKFKTQCLQRTTCEVNYEHNTFYLLQHFDASSLC